MGADRRTTYLRLTLEGRRNASVVLTGIRAVVRERAQPLDKLTITCPSEGVKEVQGISFDLDDNQSVAMNEKEGATSNYFNDYAVILKEGDIETFDINARTNECYCQWVIELDLLVNGAEQVVVLDDHGTPFATSAEPEGSSYLSSYHYQWQEAPYGFVSDLG